MRYAYINPDNTVREIIPEGAYPIAEWYNEEFASHCIEIPDYVEPNWVYDPVNEKFYEPGNMKLRSEFEILIEMGIDEV